MEKEIQAVIDITYKAEAKINDVQDRIMKGEIDRKKCLKYVKS